MRMIGAKNIDAHDGMFIIVNTTPGRQLSLLNLDYFALLLAPNWNYSVRTMLCSSAMRRMFRIA